MCNPTFSTNNPEAFLPVKDLGVTDLDCQQGSPASGHTQAEQIAARIRRRREGMGLTQVEVAQRVGVSRSAVAQWQTARAGLRSVHFYQIARVLGVSVTFLLEGSPDELHGGVTIADERTLLKLYRCLNEIGRAQFLHQGERLLAAHKTERVNDNETADLIV
jgi:transcriptional regulator with XRE-family HTH domain